VPLEFGTDGVRGVAHVELTTSLVTALGQAAARVVGPGPWLIGRDTRASGPSMAAALAAGLAAEGERVTDVGVLPTPVVAFLSEQRGVPAAMISASHNVYTDNGIKLFRAGGRKLTDDVEERLEAELRALVGASGAPEGDVPDLATVATADPDPAGAYVAHLVAALEDRRLDGMHVVLDCANGAASALAPEVLARFGAEVEVLHAAPDGTNINAASGSTHPEALQARVVAAQADVGLAFDGDADRVLAVDHTGAVVDGDHLLAICAVDLQAQGALAADTVVVTVMTNLGFHLAMAERGIAVVTTNVGDRYVLEALEEGGLTLGGEQSGHIIFRDVATTGDGLLTGLRLLDIVRRSGRTLAELAASAMTRLPQVLRNVAVADRDGLDGAPAVWDEVAAVEATLGGRGRVLLRPSGTEPVVRVMVEAPTEAEAEAAVERLCAVVSSTLAARA
jgi:phosphoglucosamine mutase